MSARILDVDADDLRAATAALQQLALALFDELFADGPGVTAERWFASAEARALDRIPFTRLDWRRLVARAEGMRDSKHTMAAMVLSSALVSLPPFYLVTIACGMMRVPFVPYVLLGLLGTTARYAFLVWLSITMQGS